MVCKTGLRGTQPRRSRMVALALTLLAGSSHAAFATDPPPPAAPYAEPGVLGDPASWDTPEFDAFWGLKAINAQNAYALGITGKDVNVGILDSGVTQTGEIAGPGKLTLLETPLGDGAGTANFTTALIGANRNGSEMQGVAYGANMFIASGSGFAGTPTAASITGAFKPFVDRGIHIIDSAWLYPVNTGLTNLVSLYGPNKPWLSAIATALVNNDLLLVTATGANNAVMPGLLNLTGSPATSVPGLAASLPYFDPTTTNHIIAVTNLGNIAPTGGLPGFGATYYVTIRGVPTLFGDPTANTCAQTRGWCVAAPGSNVNAPAVITDFTSQIDAYLADKARYDAAGYWGRLLGYFPVYNAYSAYDQYLDRSNHTWIARVVAPAQTSTAMSTATVTGEAALIAQRFPWMTTSQLDAVVLTTATYLPDGSATDQLDGNKARKLTQIPNATYGWGVIDAGLAMNGPGQMLRTETFALPAGVVAVFSNPISDSWLKYQQTTLDPADEKDWQAEIVRKGWGNGLPANASAADQAEYAYQLARAADPGSLIKDGPGTLILTGANTYGGGTVVAGGTLEGNAVSLQGHIAVASGAALLFTQDAEGTTAAVLTGPGTVTKAGAGTLTLTGDNSAASGPFAITAGTVAIAAATNLPTGPITISDGAGLAFTAPLTLTNAMTLAGGSGQIDAEADATLATPITGPGRLVKTGAATLTLSGANTYGGGTTISAGTLTGDTTSLQGAIALADGTTLNFVQASTGTYGGALSGTGLVVKNGDGMLSLSGDNSTATGGLQIKAGRVAIAAARNMVGGPLTLTGTTLQVDGPVSLANAITLEAPGGSLDTHGDTVLSGAIDGSGGLTKLGEAGLTLSGANGFTGPVTVSAGTLTLQGGVAIADSVPVLITGTSTLAIDTGERVGSIAGDGRSIVLRDALYTGGDNTDTAFSGVISGKGSLIKEGTGMFTLTGANTYGGGTVIDGGTLKGDTTSLTGDITDNALLLFAQEGDGTFAGAISGGGAIDKEGAGTLTLIGDNSGHYGGFTIAAGTVALASATNIGTGTITMTNATLAINGPADLDNDFVLGAGNQVFAVAQTSTLGGTLSGDGGLTKTGAGRLTLAGVNSYAGDTDIQAGVLHIDGEQSASRTIVEAGAILGGSGTSHGIWVKADGTIAPGHSIGTLYADAAGIQMDPGSTYHAEISPFGRADKLVTSGQAVIDHAKLLITREFVQSAISVDDLAMIAKANKLIILDAAGGVSGTFDTTYPDFAFFDTGVSYGKSFVAIHIGRNDLSFADAGTTANERAVGGAIAGLAPANPLYGALLTVPTTADAAMLEHDVAGEIHADVAGHVLSDSALMRDAVLNHMITRTPDAAAFWLEAVYDRGITAADGNAAKLDRQTSAIAGGVDQSLGGSWLVGLSGGYETAPLKTASSGTAQVNSYHAAAYGGGDLLGLSLYLGGAYGRYDVGTARSIAVLASHEDARYGINQGQAFGRIAIPVVLDDLTLEPFATGSYTEASIDDFQETDGPAALANTGQTIDRTQSVLGLRSALLFRDDDTLVTPNLTLGWVHNFDSTTPSLRLGFAGAPQTSFQVSGVTTDTEAGLVRAGIDLAAGSWFSLAIAYQGQFGQHDQQQAVQLNVKANY